MLWSKQSRLRGQGVCAQEIIGAQSLAYDAMLGDKNMNALDDIK